VVSSEQREVQEEWRRPMIRRMGKGDLDAVAAIWLDANREAHDFIPAAYWLGHFEEVRTALARAEVWGGRGSVSWRRAWIPRLGKRNFLWSGDGTARRADPRYARRMDIREVDT